MMNNWPCILKLQDEDELFYIESQQDFEQALKDHYLSESESNFLINTTGQMTAVSAPDFPLNNAQLRLVDFNQLLRNHLSALNQCCVLKIQITSFDQGFKMIRDTQND